MGFSDFLVTLAISFAAVVAGCTLLSFNDEYDRLRGGFINPLDFYRFFSVIIVVAILPYLIWWLTADRLKVANDLVAVLCVIAYYVVAFWFWLHLKTKRHDDESAATKDDGQDQ